MNINIKTKFKFFTPKKNKNFDIERVLPLTILNINDKDKVCWWKHKSKTNNFIEYEKMNPKTKKLVKIIKGSCSICCRNKPQIFTK